MGISDFLFVLCLLQTYCDLTSSTLFNALERGASLHEKTNDMLISPNGVYSSGFVSVGINAFGFATWFTNSPNQALVWMANRDQPVGRKSKLSLLNNGNLILKDAGKKVVWSTATAASSQSVELWLLNTGNLVLRTWDGVSVTTLWQSFDFPTDTLLPEQVLTKDTYLVSSKSQTNYSSGNYKLFFDNDNVLRLLYQGPDTTSIYWPPAWLLPYQSERSTYNSSRTAVLDPSGYFNSSDRLEFSSSDFGLGPLRRLTLDPDGNLRLYSLEENNKQWVVSWQAIPQACMVHGVCGPNGVCTYGRGLGRTCSCLPGYRVKNISDWSSGCEPKFNFSCNHNEFGYLNFTHVEFYGYDTAAIHDVSLTRCKETCLKMCSCRGFQYKIDHDKNKGRSTCYPKTLLFNGHHTPSFNGEIYLKLPKDILNEKKIVVELKLDCSRQNISQPLNRNYATPQENGTVKVFLWFASAVGAVEVICIFFLWVFLFTVNQDSYEAVRQEFLLAATAGFKKFTYAELKKATKGFTEEIGRGAGGVVYRALLSDQRVAAVKRLISESNQGEAEFLTEVQTIGKLNHMNLIEMWGYCAEGNHRLLVYEYMEHGSLADNLYSSSLSWHKRFEIAVGTAKGLAYLHDECLEWVLHCDIKPQNILLDSCYQPKLADFGLSKLQTRGGLNHDSSFSRIRGTRGYMAPEWVYNLPITSKVDVYSYGIVLLELVTGKTPSAALQTFEIQGVTEHGRLVTWVRERKNGAPTTAAWIEEIVDPIIASNYDGNKMEILVKVALQCVEEDRDARLSMSKVMEMLLG